MLTQEQLKDLRTFLEQSLNPIFFFDNDVDGLASFLIFRKFCGKGKGVAIKSYPSLGQQYNRKIEEFGPDIIFVLDKPLISQEFINFAKEKNLRIIWLDHHPRPKESYESNITYFNPLENEPRDNKPTSYWAYKVIKNKEYEWIATIGCLGDWFIPEFAQDFSRDYPELLPSTTSPSKALYETKIGNIVKILNFSLKDKTSAIVRMIKILLEINTPEQINEENKKIIPIYKRYEYVNRRYTKLIERAKEIASRSSRLLFFKYSGALSLSSELSNELFYLFPDKIIVVAYIKGTKVNCSIRGIGNVRDLIQKALRGIESSSGGHESASGATFQVEDLKRFKENLMKLMIKGKD